VIKKADLSQNLNLSQKITSKNLFIGITDLLQAYDKYNFVMYLTNNLYYDT